MNEDTATIKSAPKKSIMSRVSWKRIGKIVGITAAGVAVGCAAVYCLRSGKTEAVVEAFRRI